MGHDGLAVQQSAQEAAVRVLFLIKRLFVCLGLQAFIRHM